MNLGKSEAGCLRVDDVEGRSGSMSESRSIERIREQGGEVAQRRARNPRKSSCERSVEFNEWKGVGRARAVEWWRGGRESVSRSTALMALDESGRWGFRGAR